MNARRQRWADPEWRHQYGRIPAMNTDGITPNVNLLEDAGWEIDCAHRSVATRILIADHYDGNDLSAVMNTDEYGILEPMNVSYDIAPDNLSTNCIIAQHQACDALMVIIDRQQGAGFVKWSCKCLCHHASHWDRATYASDRQT